jgi:hypothetical protein
MSLLRLDRPLFNFDVPGSYRLAITFIGGLLLLGTVGALASMVRIGVHRNKPVGGVE